MGPTPDPAARSPPGEACNDKTSGGSLEGSEHLPSTSPHPEGSARACGIGVWAAPQGKSGEGGGPWEGGREGLASSGGQWGLPFLGLGVCGPSSGGPEVHERFLFPRMAGGAYTLNNGATMVVSRGLARESTPLPRFFNHPEVVIVNLRPKM